METIFFKEKVCLAVKDSVKWQVPTLKWRDWLFVLLICAFSLFLRSWHLGFPSESYFDEIYYGPAALDYIAGRADSNTVHPPLGKLQIAGGILVLREINALYGHKLFSEQWQWRFASMICGSAMVLFTFLLGYRISRGKRALALLAAFLVAIDFMAVTMSRVCMLDMINSLWILVGIYCCWRYLEACWNSGRRRLWAVLTSIALAAATACKWNGLFAAGGCWLAMVFLRDASWAEMGQSARSFSWPEWKRAFAAAVKNGWKPGCKLAVLMAAVTAAVYILSYLPLFMRMGWGTDAWREIWGYHTLMFSFRYDTKQFTHSYLSYFWEWPLVLRPIWFYFESGENHAKVNGIISFGSVLFWWPVLIYMAESCFYGIKKRDAVRLFLVGLWLVQWLLWSSSTTGGFIYYMLPAVPLMALVGAVVICDWCEIKADWMAAVYIGMLAVAFIVYWPFLSGETTTMAHFGRCFPGWLPRWR